MSWKDAFKSVSPGEQPPPVPPSLRLWTSQTTYGILGGMLFGGYRGLVQARDPSHPSPTPTASSRHRATAFFVRESILTGARVGLFTATFSATALVAEGLTGHTGAVSYATAGAVTCGLFAGAVGGGTVVPAAAAFGGLVGSAAGFVTQTLNDAMVEQGVGEGNGKVERSVEQVVKQIEETMTTTQAKEGTKRSEFLNGADHEV